ncbi:MAG: AAA family ATPase [Gemmatimonadota bacterium]|nr:MAG: AAA family ATPase [Gemmatimonadota bacterium]
MISLRVLGPVEVIVDGNPAPGELLWRKNLALLVYLARSPKRTRSRDHLVGLLWGEKPESAARHSLNEAIHVLRKHAGPESLESEGGQVRLALAAVELDADRLEGLLEDDDWRGAARLIAGDFMEGFSVPGCSEFEDWLYGERTALRQRSLEALVNLAEQLTDRGELREATGTAQRALALGPTSEAAVGAAMRAMAIAGDRAGALALYDAFVRRLAEEIGIEPEEEIQGLAERVRRERTWKLPEAVAVGVQAGGESRRAPLVGRESELARLLGAWSGCRDRGRAALGVIEGDPGTGRTRLAEELLARARLGGAAVATARAVEADASEAWSGVLALARGVPLDAPGLDAAPRAAVAALAARLPAWAERFGPSDGGTDLTPGRALADVLRAAAAEAPVFLFVDDAQWLDRDSLLALAALLRDLERTPVFVLVAAAPFPERAELEELRTHIGRELEGVALRLGPLSVEALHALARWALPSYDEVQLDRVARRVATDSAGLPLLAVELLHAVALGLDLGLATGAWPEPLRTLDQTLPGELPDAVAAAVRVGFRRLSHNAQTTLAAASVLGDRVDAATLERATRLDSEPLAAALDELEWQRWISAEARGYSFVARIVREVVARDMLTEGQRRRIAEAVGR